MAQAVPFLMMAGSTISAVGALRQGQASRDASNYNAAIMQQNAVIARQEAADLARQFDRETIQRMGAIRAAQGHAGGDAGAGSVLDVLGDVAAQSELEKQNILYRGELKARGYTNTADLDRMAGANAVRSSRYQAGAELLSGAGNAYFARSRMARV